jgi:hypothetical protein
MELLSLGFAKEGSKPPGVFPRHLFCSQGFHMPELSIMCDESGEWGKLSEYYLITLVFHDQVVRNI